MTKDTLRSTLFVLVVSLSVSAAGIVEAQAGAGGGHRGGSVVIMVALISGVATVLAALFGKQAAS
jgi:hypothetical protein